MNTGQDATGVSSLSHIGFIVDANDEPRKSTTEEISRRKCVCSFQKRHIFSFLTFIACTLAISYASSVSITIVSMVNRTKSHVQANQCRENEDIQKVQKHGEFDWSSDTQGFAISAVFYGEMVSLVPGGRLAELCGGKLVLILSILGSSLLTIMQPFAAYYDKNAFIVVRFLIGIFVGPVVPAVLYMISNWIPESQRSFQSSIIFSGYGMGCFVAVLVGGALCESDFLGGWPSFFYVLGFYGLIWCVFAFFLLCETPRSHPTITDVELLYITQSLGHAQEQITNVKWGEVFSSVQMWLLAGAYFSQFWLIAFFFTVEPLYMGTILHLNITENGMLSSIPHFARAIFAVIVSYPADWVIEKGYASNAFVRKGATFLNSFISCLGFAGILVSGCNSASTTAFFTLASLLGDFITFGVSMATIEMAPNLAGTMCGFYNVIGVSAFVIIPSLVGMFTRYETTIKQWSYVFYTTIGVVALTTIPYTVFGTVKPQPWGTVRKPNTEI